MRVQLWKNVKTSDNQPDYIVTQKQRLNDGTTAYETNQVGVGYKQEAPSGEIYIDIKLEGFGTNNKPTP